MLRFPRASLLIAALGAATALIGSAARAENQQLPVAAGPSGSGSSSGVEPASGPLTAVVGAAPAAAPPPEGGTEDRGRQLIAPTPAQSPPLEINLSADQQGFDLLANRFVATGNVRVLLSGGRLLADRLEYEAATRTIYASGRVRFQRGSQYLQASRLRYSLLEDSGELDEVYGVLDLDSSALDLNPEQSPSAPLLPLSYWEQLAAPFTEPISLSIEGNAPPGQATARQNDGRRAQPQPAGMAGAKASGAALSAQPFAGSDSSQPTLQITAISAQTERLSGVPMPLALDDWRMPPVALAPDGQTMACPPPIPPVPDWHPYPWAATLWGGQMISAQFDDTFIFRGDMRPDYLLGLGLNRRLLRAGPLALEFDTNALLHREGAQPGGGYNQSTPYAITPSQTYGEFTWGLGLRAWLQPWLSLGFVEGVSLYTAPSNYEKTFRQNYSTFLNYLGFEVEALMAPAWSVVGRIHHRSGAYGTYGGVKEGSNAYLLGLRYRFGSEPPKRLGVAMAPPDGCRGADIAERLRTRPLADQLQLIAFGSPQQATATPGPISSAGQPGNTPLPPAQQEQLRREAIAATVDQRVSNLQFERSFSAERRLGVTGQEYSTGAQEVAYGSVQPAQTRTLLVSENKQLIKGTVNRWRMQANRITVTPSGWMADRVAFSNDPYTPAQAWVDAAGVKARLEANGDIVIQAERNQLILEDRLPIPLQRNQRFEKKREIENRWVLASDGQDRDGSYIGYNLNPISVGSSGSLNLQPQFMVRRALDGTTDSYVLPGQSAGDSASSQPTRIGDLFGLLAKYQGNLFGFKTEATADISTFDPSNFANGTRSWGNMTSEIKLPLLGVATARGFAAYRYRVWNGSLGEQDVYSAVGASVEQTVALPNLGAMSHQLFWRAGAGNFQGNDFNTTNLGDLWRGTLVASLNSSLPIWTGKALPPGPESATRFSPVPIVPGLVLNTNTSLNLAYYSDGTYQNLFSISGGPTLTLGHLQRNFLDYTQLTITGGGTLREGLSPFSFDRAVDLSTVGIGLTQQLVGPLLLNGGVALNVDPNSGYFGDTVGAYVELRWQRRAYEFAIYYSPYEQIGGIRVKLNDFNFSGTGIPFVPYTPANLANDPAAIQRRGF